MFASLFMISQSHSFSLGSLLCSFGSEYSRMIHSCSLPSFPFFLWSPPGELSLVCCCVPKVWEVPISHCMVHCSPLSLPKLFFFSLVIVALDKGFFGPTQVGAYSIQNVATLSGVGLAARLQGLDPNITSMRPRPLGPDSPET